MATTRALLVVAMAAAALVGTATGATYTVGAPGGSWDLRTNYTQWASGLTFRAGDQLLFSYSTAAHDVVEVSKADYDACSASTPVSTFSTGNDVVSLTAAGTRYYICGVPEHCDAGMKVQVNVEAAAPAGGAPAPVNTPARARAASVVPPTANAPAAGGGQAMPPSSSAASVGVGSVSGLALGAVVTVAVMLFY